MKYTIASTEINLEDFEYREYVCDCEENSINPGDKNSSAFYEWAAELVAHYFEEDLENIRHCEDYDVPVVITGSLGRWDGRHEIVPARRESVFDAVMDCIRGKDDAEVEWEDGVIRIFGYHHDGTNVYEVRALSKKGVNKKYADYKPHDFKKLPYLYNI